jgi:hypothetical protein
MPTITQAELDAMLASGELSLTPPGEPSNEAPAQEQNSLPEITDSVQMKTEETPPAPSFEIPKPVYDMPEPKPMGRAYTKEENKYLLETRRALKEIENPEYRRMASEVTGSGYRLSDIDGAVAYLKSLDESERVPKIAKESMTKDILSLDDGEIKAEAFRVINDPTMSTDQKLHAVTAYKESFGSTEGGSDKFTRMLDDVQSLESKTSRTPQEDQRLEWLKKKLVKETSVAMSDLSKKERDYESIAGKFKKTLPENLQGVSLAEIDTRKLTEAQLAEAQKVGNWAMKAQGINTGVVNKEVINLGQQIKEAENVMKHTLYQLKNGKEFNALERKYRDVFSNYFGLSDTQMQAAFRDKQAQSFFNKFRHGLFGASLSKIEKPEFERSASTLYRSNSDIGAAITSMLDSQIGRIKGMQLVMGNEAFNLKFGTMYRNLLDMQAEHKKALDIAGNEDKDSKDDGFMNPDAILSGNSSAPKPTSENNEDQAFSVDYFRQKYGK